MLANNYFKFISILFIFLMVASCSNDEPKDDDLIIKLQGTWIAEEYTVKSDDIKVDMSIDKLKDLLVQDEYIDEVITFYEGKVNGLNYQVKNNRILLPWYDEWFEVSFSKSKLSFYYTEYIDGEKVEIWIIYKKADSRTSVDSYQTESFLKNSIIKSARISK